MNKLLASLLTLCALTPLSLLAQQTNIGYIFPTGGAQGSELIVEVGGQGIKGAQRVLTSGEGLHAEILPQLAAPTEYFINKRGKKVPRKNKKRGKKNKKTITAEDNLQLADRIRVKISIDKDAPLGLRDFKIVSKSGIVSNRQYFEISQLPNHIEKEPNNKLQQANQINQLPAILCGQVERGGRDYYRFEGKQAQCIVAAVKARALVPFLADAVPGWFQPTLILYDESGRELAFNDDYLLQPDPVIIYKLPKDGSYSLAIQDSIFRGREDFVYRISLGEIPFVTSIYPMGGRCGSKLNLQLSGVNLGEKQRSINTSEQEGRYNYSFSNGQQLQSNDIQLQVSNKREIVQQDDISDSPQAAAPLSLEDIYNERISKDADQDWYRVQLKAGDKIKFQLMARRLGSPLDGRLCLYDKQKKLLAQSDDVIDSNEGMLTHHADPQLNYNCKTDGEYLLRVTDIQNTFGDKHIYRLSYDHQLSDFALRIEPSAISIPQGGSAQFRLYPVRVNGFDQEIDIIAEGLPEGYQISKGSIPRRGKQLQMSITAPKDAKVGPLKLRIKGVSKRRRGRGIISSHHAEPVEKMMQAFYIDHLLPSSGFRVDVSEAQPFRIILAQQDEPVQLEADKPIAINLRIERQEGFNKAILLMLKGSNKYIPCETVKVEPDQTEATLIINCKAWRRPGMLITTYLLATDNLGMKNRPLGKNNKVKPGTSLVYSPNFSLRYPQQAPSAEQDIRQINKNKNKK